MVCVTELFYNFARASSTAVIFFNGTAYAYLLKVFVNVIRYLCINIRKPYNLYVLLFITGQRASQFSSGCQYSSVSHIGTRLYWSAEKKYIRLCPIENDAYINIRKPYKLYALLVTAGHGASKFWSGRQDSSLSHIGSRMGGKNSLQRDNKNTLNLLYQ